jgi:acyl-CoA thioester hydrolase
MESYKIPLQLRWADVDQNRHLRHSVYYDYGALIRIKFLSEQGLTTQKMEELKFGPIIFREEAVFKREIKFEDEVTIDVELVKANEDFTRWTIRHNIVKADGTLATVLTLDGAWLDVEKRKLAEPPQMVKDGFNSFPKAKDFEWVVKKEA